MVRRYRHDDHFELLKLWNDVRGQGGLEPWMLPKLGFVCDGKAVAFLVTTNSCVAWIANWTVNPLLSKEERDEVVNELSDRLEREARKRGFKLVQTLGKTFHNLAARLKDRGYVSADGTFTFLVKDIRS